MPLILPGNVATATASTAFNVDNSCRFDGTSNEDKLTRTPGSAGNVDQWTFSCWLKKVKNGATDYYPPLYTESGSDYTKIEFYEDKIRFKNYISSSVNGNLITTQVFRDPAAWYHLVFVYDSGNATEGNRCILYINGTRVTAFSSETYPAEDANSLVCSTVAHSIGNETGKADLAFHGYMAEVALCDGQAYAASDFGELILIHLLFGNRKIFQD